AGMLVSNKNMGMTKKSMYFIGAGIVLCVLGYLWGLQFPIVKRLWTSSYVLFAGGWSCILLGMFTLIIDVAGFRKWAVPFVWIGANPLTIYILSSIVDFPELGARIVGGPWGESVFGQYTEI